MVEFLARVTAYRSTPEKNVKGDVSGGAPFGVSPPSDAG
jgi:hypothetical protein